VFRVDSFFSRDSIIASRLFLKSFARRIIFFLFCAKTALHKNGLLAAILVILSKLPAAASLTERCFFSKRQKDSAKLKAIRCGR